MPSRHKRRGRSYSPSSSSSTSHSRKRHTKNSKYSTRSHSRNKEKRQRNSKSVKTKWNEDNAGKDEEADLQSKHLQNLKDIESQFSILPSQSFRTSKKLYISNFPPGITPSALCDLINVALIEGGLDTFPNCLDVFIHNDKTYAFADFRTPEAATKAMSLDGFSCMGHRLNVKRSRDYAPCETPPELLKLLRDSAEAYKKKNPQKKEEKIQLVHFVTGIPIEYSSDSEYLIYVAGFPQNTSESVVKSILQLFGPLQSFEYPRDEITGNTLGFVLFELANTEQTQTCVDVLNGMVAGQIQLSASRVFIDVKEFSRFSMNLMKKRGVTSKDSSLVAPSTWIEMSSRRTAMRTALYSSSAFATSSSSSSSSDTSSLQTSTAAVSLPPIFPTSSSSFALAQKSSDLASFMSSSSSSSALSMMLPSPTESARLPVILSPSPVLLILGAYSFSSLPRSVFAKLNAKSISLGSTKDEDKSDFGKENRKQATTSAASSSSKRTVRSRSLSSSSSSSSSSSMKKIKSDHRHKHRSLSKSSRSSSSSSYSSHSSSYSSSPSSSSYSSYSSSSSISDSSSISSSFSSYSSSSSSFDAKSSSRRGRRQHRGRSPSLKHHHSKEAKLADKPKGEEKARTQSSAAESHATSHHHQEHSEPQAASSKSSHSKQHPNASKLADHSKQGDSSISSEGEHSNGTSKPEKELTKTQDVTTEQEKSRQKERESKECANVENKTKHSSISPSNAQPIPSSSSSSSSSSFDDEKILSLLPCDARTSLCVSLGKSFGKVVSWRRGFDETDGIFASHKERSYLGLYIMFDSSETAMCAMKKLIGRRIGCTPLVVLYYPADLYEKNIFV